MILDVLLAFVAHDPKITDLVIPWHGAPQKVPYNIDIVSFHNDTIKYRNDYLHWDMDFVFYPFPLK